RPQRRQTRSVASTRPVLCLAPPDGFEDARGFSLMAAQRVERDGLLAKLAERGECGRRWDVRTNGEFDVQRRQKTLRLVADQILEQLKGALRSLGVRRYPRAGDVHVRAGAGLIGEDERRAFSDLTIRGIVRLLQSHPVIVIDQR